MTHLTLISIGTDDATRTASIEALKTRLNDSLFDTVYCADDPAVLDFTIGVLRGRRHATPTPDRRLCAPANTSGETLAEVVARLVAFREHLTNQEDNHLLIVTGPEIMALLLGFIDEIDPEQALTRADSQAYAVQAVHEHEWTLERIWPE